MSPLLPHRRGSAQGPTDPGATASEGETGAPVTLADLLGALASDITAARAQADAQAVRIAQLYREDPLLRTLPVPHFRLADLTITMPLAILAVPKAQEAEPPKGLEAEPGPPSEGVAVAATTAEIQSASASEALMQLRVNFTEHGLEWAVGEEHERLVPE